MTLEGRNSQIGKSKAYFEALRNNCREAYDFYKEYGNGDLVKGYRDSLDETEKYRADLTILWYYYKDTKGLKIKDMLKPIYNLFNSEHAANVIIRKLVWVDAIKRVEPKKKLYVLKTLWEYHKDTIKKAKNHYKDL